MPIIFNTDTDISRFRDLGVEANKYYKPLRDFPNSTALYNKLINFPLHCDLMDYEIDYIVKIKN